MTSSFGRECPACGGSALDVTANDDRAYHYICGAGCSHQWEEPFPAPARAMHRMADSAEQAATSFEKFVEAYQAANDAEQRRFLADVYGCPADLVDDVARVRLADLFSDQEGVPST